MDRRREATGLCIAGLVDMVFLPGNLIQPYALQEFHDILPPVIMWGAVVILAHEDDGHIGEELGQLVASLYHAGGVHGDGLLDGYDGKGDSLLDDDSAVNGHKRPSFLQMRLLILVFIVTKSIHWGKDL